MDPKIVQYAGSTAVGVVVRTRNSDEMEPTKAKIGALWQRFFRDELGSKITGSVQPSTVVGVYSDYESDHTGAYSLLVGLLTKPNAAVPDGMTKIAIPAGKYLVFEARESMPRALIDTWGAIWKHFDRSAAQRRAYSVDFELHRADGSVDIHIAVV